MFLDRKLEYLVGHVKPGELLETLKSFKDRAISRQAFIDEYNREASETIEQQAAKVGLNLVE